MKQDKHFTRVAFRKFEDGSVIAIMPDDIWLDGRNNTLLTSYMHVGKHGGCSHELLTELDIAVRKEYKDLWRELESLGYKLRLYKEIKHELRKNRSSVA